MERALEFDAKRIYIAPYTPKTTMFAKELQAQYDCRFLGFIDNFQKGDACIKPEHIAQEYDLVLILSQNHGNAIYKDLEKKLPQKKLIKVEQEGGSYTFLEPQQMQALLCKEKMQKRKQSFLKISTRVLDLLNFKRTKIAFLSKGSITSNNKALFLHCYKEGLDLSILTDNVAQYNELQDLNLPVVWLESWQAYALMARAKYIVQDQANLTEEIMLLSPQQKRVQMWHGIPLKRLNKLTTVAYDTLISTSDFVNETTLGKVIEAKEYKDLGYPRNDLFLKENHDQYDLLFCDKEIYTFAKRNFGSKHKVALYMPTHRESSKASKIPLDFEKLNIFLAHNKITLIVKLHHFVVDLYAQEKRYCNILFHSTHGDVYPLLKYTDILITDYSSVFFDFLLLERAIIFFDYDREEYEANMQGFLYEYESFTPGVHVRDQKELQSALSIREDLYKEQRAFLAAKLYTHPDAKSSARIFHELFL